MFSDRILMFTDWILFRPFMHSTDWAELTDRNVIDYCNYCTSHYHKSAGMYTYDLGGNLQDDLALEDAVRTATLGDGHGMTRGRRACDMCTISSWEDQLTEHHLHRK